MILKKVEDGVVVSAIEIISFDIQIEDRKAAVKVVLDDAQNSKQLIISLPGINISTKLLMIIMMF